MAPDWASQWQWQPWSVQAVVPLRPYMNIFETLLQAVEHAAGVFTTPL